MKQKIAVRSLLSNFLYLRFRITLYCKLLLIDVTSDDLPEVEFADWSESKKLLVTTVIIKCVEYLQKEDKSAPPSPAEGLTVLPVLTASPYLPPFK